jgi:hypothetical protein
MQNIHKMVKVINNQAIVDLPPEFSGHEVEVILRSPKQKDTLTHINKMIFAEEFQKTRQSYQSRNLGYAQFESGELTLISELKLWVIAIKEVAENLPKAIEIVSQWKNSEANPKAFAIWYK